MQVYVQILNKRYLRQVAFKQEICILQRQTADIQHSLKINI